MLNDLQGQGGETADESFADILNEFESASRAARKDAAAPSAKGKGKSKRAGPPPRRGTVVGVSGDLF